MWNRGKRQNIGQSVWQFRMVVCQVADNPLEIGEDGFNGRKVRRVRWKMEGSHHWQLGSRQPLHYSRKNYRRAARNQAVGPPTTDPARTHSYVAQGWWKRSHSRHRIKMAEPRSPSTPKLQNWTRWQRWRRSVDGGGGREPRPRAVDQRVIDRGVESSPRRACGLRQQPQYICQGCVWTAYSASKSEPNTVRWPAAGLF